MNNMIIYIFQVSVIFSVFYLVYKLVFSKFTFHTINRVLLLSVLPVSLVLPWVASVFPHTITTSVIEIPSLFENMHSSTITTPLFNTETYQESITANYMIEILFAIYSLGVLIGLFRFYKSIRHLFILKNHNISVKKEGHTLVFADITSIFSYFQWIFVPQKAQYDPLIMVHERAHIQLRHTIDLIIAELYIIIFWCNPIVYLYRKSLKSVHEFQADAFVLKKEVKTSRYLELVLHSLELKNTDRLYSYFNTPILKKRINMMTKTTSRAYLKVTYALLIPVCLLLVFAFTKPPTFDTSIIGVTEIFESTIETPTFLFPIQNSSKEHITAFFDVKIKDPISKTTKTHTGIDIKAKIGTPIIATEDGMIAFASGKKAWGNLIVITHDQGYETWYAHLKSFAIKEKQYVAKGDIIGYVGTTGNSTGPHLHYELKKNHKSLNPMAYFEN